MPGDELESGDGGLTPSVAALLLVSEVCGSGEDDPPDAVGELLGEADGEDDDEAEGEDDGEGVGVPPGLPSLITFACWTDSHRFASSADGACRTVTSTGGASATVDDDDADESGVASLGEGVGSVEGDGGVVTSDTSRACDEVKGAIWSTARSTARPDPAPPPPPTAARPQTRSCQMTADHQRPRRSRLHPDRQPVA